MSQQIYWLKSFFSNRQRSEFAESSNTQICITGILLRHIKMILATYHTGPTEKLRQHAELQEGPGVCGGRTPVLTGRGRLRLKCINTL